MAGLWLIGVALAGFAALRASDRRGVASALPFIAAAVALTGVAIGVLRAKPAAAAVSVGLLGAQLVGVVGSAWELVGGVHGTKARELHRLGIDPELGVALNLAYSAVASTVFIWVVARWRAARRQRRTTPNR